MGMWRMRTTAGKVHLVGVVDGFGSCGKRKTLRLEDRWGRVGAGGCGGRGRGWLAFSWRGDGGLRKEGGTYEEIEEKTKRTRGKKE